MSKTRIIIDGIGLAAAEIVPSWTKDLLPLDVDLLRYVPKSDVVACLQFSHNLYQCGNSYDFLIRVMGTLEDNSTFSETWDAVWRALTCSDDPNYNRDELSFLRLELQDLVAANCKKFSEAYRNEVFFYQYVVTWVAHRNVLPNNEFCLSRLAFANCYKFATWLGLASHEFLLLSFQ